MTPYHFFYQRDQRSVRDVMEGGVPKKRNVSVLNKKSGKGFTLIELLVSVSLFVVVMMVSVGTLLSLVDANRQAQTLKSVTNNLNFALDSMTRALRTGFEFQCGSGGDCGGTGGGTSINFKDDKGCLVTFAYDSVNHSIVRTVANSVYNSSCSTSSNLRLTAPEVNVTDMRFYMTGTPEGDTVQPLVTMSIKGIMGGKVDSTFNVEASVVQRMLDI